MHWLQKLIKFGLVGFVGLIIDFGITYFLKEKIGANKYFANSCGFSVAVVNNFYLNKVWTFNNTAGDTWLQLLKFISFSLVGLVINLALLLFFHRVVKVKFYGAKALSIICVFFWNFSTNLFFNFH